MRTVPSAAAHLYRVLVHLYPPAFRRQFASEMAGDFEEATSEAWRDGRWRAVVPLWIHIARDFTRTLACQWLRHAPPIMWLLASSSAAACAFAIAQTVRRPLVLAAFVSPTDQDKAVLLFLATMVILVATILILFTVCFRLLVPRSTGRPRRV